ncbi:Saccharopine dehydrogenase, partial [Fusarium falciforme]
MEDGDDRASPPKLGPVESGTFDVQINAGDTDKKMSELQQQLDDKDELIQHLKSELQKKEESLAFMRKKAADAAAKAADMPPALVLLRSEEELINGWNDLANEISNFVRGYLKNVDRKNREKWMATNKRKLKEIAPSYKKIAADSKHLHWLIEALIWRLLYQHIFGSSTNEAPIAWGGRYGDLLSELGSALMESLEQEDERFQRLYHHWKALSTNLFDMAGLQEMSEARVNKIMEVLGGALGDLLSTSAAKDMLYLKALLSIVRNATSLDRLFSGQMKWYLAYYPPERHGTESRPRISFESQSQACLPTQPSYSVPRRSPSSTAPSPPAVIKTLVDAGYPISVERSSTDPNFKRIFEDSEYEAAGASLIPAGSWPEAPAGTLILGLKEIPEADFPLKNDHISFAHCYKNQGGWEKVLSRFPRGGSVLYDLEFLNDEHGRRVSAFGFHAGFTGAALGLKTLQWQLAHPGEKLPSVGTFTDGRGYYLNEEELVNQIREDLASAEKALGRKPTAMVLGALGRCGRGAVDLFLKAGIPEENITRWDIQETQAREGPYEEIAQHDIFLNAIYLSKPIPPFVNDELLSQPGRKLSVVIDVSCDTTNPHNPIPIYSINTTFDDPTVPVTVKDDQNTSPLSVISIDHLPSMLPREASEAFSEGLKESLLTLNERKTSRVWA